MGINSFLNFPPATICHSVKSAHIEVVAFDMGIKFHFPATILPFLSLFLCCNIYGKVSLNLNLLHMHAAFDHCGHFDKNELTNLSIPEYRWGSAGSEDVPAWPNIMIHEGPITWLWPIGADTKAPGQ